MREFEIIRHKGKEIIYLNYSHLKTLEEIENVTVSASKLIRTRPANSVLSLVNLEAMHFNNNIKNMIASNLKVNKPYVKKSAAFGLTGLLGSVFATYIKVTGREVKACKSKEEALEYLVSS